MTINARRAGQSDDLASRTVAFNGGWGTEQLAVDVPADLLVSCIGPDGARPCDVTFKLQGPEARFSLEAQLRAPGQYAVAMTPRLQQIREFERLVSASSGTQPDVRAHCTLVGQSDLLGEVHAPVTEETSTVTLAFAPPASLLLTIPVDAPAEFRAQLEGRADGGVDSEWRHVSRYRGRSGQRVPRTFEADGTLLLTGLQPGVHVITVSSQRDRSYGLAGEAGPPRDPITVTAALRIQAGENVHAVTIPERFELEVRAPDHPAGTQLTLQPAGPTAGGNRFAEDHRSALDDQHGAVFERIPRGTYTLVARWGDGTSEREVTVPGPTITLKRMKLRGFRLGYLFPGGLAEAAGLRTGDLVVEVDGQPVDSTSMQRLRLDVGRRQATLTVERDGVRHQLKLGLGDPGLPTYQQLGMQFTAVED